MPGNKPVKRENAHGELRVPTNIERSFCGEREQQNCRVWIEADKTRLPLIQQEHQELDAPVQFDWGYGGRGSAKLALAILMSVLEDKVLAKRLQHAFKMAYVAKWQERWSITSREVQRFAADELAGDKIAVAPRFRTGRLVATPGALARIPRSELNSALQRHKSCDWGELDRHDWQANQDALVLDMRLFSVYYAINGEKFWIITEADRTVTTFLLPEEY